MAKRLKVYKSHKRSKAMSKFSIRTVKMLRPICNECSQVGLGWWVECPHDPYHRLKPVTVRTERRVVDPESGLVTKTEEEKKVSHWAHVPNIMQIPLTIRINSGWGVEAALAKGFLFPQDVRPTLADGSWDEEFDGYAPMCEYQNCYEVNPTVRARHAGLTENRMIPQERYTGLYCSEFHARLAKQQDSETLQREVNNDTKRREQLDAISLP